MFLSWTCPPFYNPVESCVRQRFHSSCCAADTAAVAHCSNWLHNASYFSAFSVLLHGIIVRTLALVRQPMHVVPRQSGNFCTCVGHQSRFKLLKYAQPNTATQPNIHQPKNVAPQPNSVPQQNIVPQPKECRQIL